MGTSKGYGMPTGGPWTPVKRDFTRFAKQGPTPTLTPQGLLSGFLGASGGADRISRGSGQGGQGGRGGGGGGGGSIGRAARSAGQNLGGFLSSVVTVGLDEALRDVGLGDLVGRQAREVTAGLVEVLVGPASTLDDDAARDAFIDLNDELMRETATYVEVKKIFSTVLDENGISRLLIRFFSRYIFHLVRRNFYEKLLKQESRDKAGHTLKSIRDCIKSKLEAKLGNRNLLHVKWKGAEGRRITETIFRDTIRIYEASA